MVLWTDASSHGGGDYYEETDDHGEVHVKKSSYYWDDDTFSEAINYKELKQIEKSLRRHGERFRNSRLTLMCDNKATVAIWNKLSSSKIKYSRVVCNIFDETQKYNIHLRLEWVPTTVQLADEPS